MALCQMFITYIQFNFMAQRNPRQQIENIVRLQEEASRLSDDLVTCIAGDVPLRYRNCLCIANGLWNAALGKQFKIKIMDFLFDSQLFLENNQYPNILQDIKMVRFPYLKKIFLSNNHICSVELICRIKFENLQVLGLDQNHINEAISLRKGHWPEISRILLNNNYVKETKTLCQLFSPKLGFLSLNFLGDIQNQQSDPTWLAKIKLSKPSTVNIDGTRRIRDKKFKRIVTLFS